MALTVGSLLAGRYEITAPIATGGMGEVWKARDQVLDRDVAAKVLRSEYTGDPSFLARFRNEARHTAALTHPNIASVYDYGETEQDGQQLAFLVMELVDGQPLVTILHDEQRLPVDWTLHVLSQSADGLSAAHRAGVVHRDIKPGNLLVRPDGVVKLTDFGIAQARDTTPLTRTGMVVGTAQYLSPEQAQGLEVTAASDVYSLGVVGYECLAGERPFDGASQVAIALAHINRTPPPLPADVPPAVRLLVERALAKDPADRFPDGGAFAEAIRRVAAGGAVTPPRRTGPGTTPVPVVAGPATGLSNSRTRVFGAVTAAAAAAGEVAGAAPATGAIPRTGPHARAGAGSALSGPGRALPPLHAPDDEDWLEDDEFPPDAGPGRGRWLWVAAAVALLLILAGGAWFLLGGSGGSGQIATSSSAAQSSARPTGIFLDPAAFIGHPVSDASKELTDAGLKVVTQNATRAMLEALDRSLNPDDVAGIDPKNVQAQAGDTVTLFVARNGFTPESGSTAPTSAPATTSAARTTAPSVAPTSASVATSASVSVPSSAPTTTTTATSSVAPASSASAPPTTTDGSAGAADAP
jgi:eukaryotic-like serine/threonine-protein kinase